jgi:hypothetical protein
LASIQYIESLSGQKRSPSPRLVSRTTTTPITMAVSRGKQYITQEVKPSNAGGANLAPSSPPGSPSTKKARFANAPIEGVSRPLSTTEAWSMWHFETHARQCRECYNPLEVHQKGKRLCDTGHALAQDVAEHVYHQAGEVYSKKNDSHKLVRVELPPNYTHTKGLLRAMDRAVRSTSRTTPIISYDPTYPVTRRRSPSPDRRRRYRDENQTETVYIEPNNTERERRPRRRATHKSRRYSAVVVNDDIEADLTRQPEKKPDARRGSLYDTDIQRLKKDKGYLVEIREPQSRRHRSPERRRERDRDGRRTS